MRLLKVLSSIVFTVALLVSSFGYQAQAQQNENVKKYVKIEVDGLSCPFCAYGLEKNLLEIDGVDNIKIIFDSAYVKLTIPSDSKVTKVEIKQIIKDAGFTAKNVLFKDKPFNN